MHAIEGNLISYLVKVVGSSLTSFYCDPLSDNIKLDKYVRQLLDNAKQSIKIKCVRFSTLSPANLSMTKQKKEKYNLIPCID